MRTVPISEGAQWAIRYLSKRCLWPGMTPSLALTVQHHLSEDGCPSDCSTGSKEGVLGRSSWGSFAASHFSTSRGFYSLTRDPRRQLSQTAVRAAATPASAQPPTVQQTTPSDTKQAPAPEDKVSAKASVIFDSCWRRLEDRLKDTYQIPKEIVWLNGAPGSGKGANTPYILESRGLTRAVTMSSLLERHPGIRDLMDRGELVPDSMVGDALLDVIFDPDQSDGAGLIVDGFPRTAMQVEFLKLLYDKMLGLHLQHAGSLNEWRFPRPSFKVVVLYVEQDESVRRQCLRAQLATQHNRRVADAGTGRLQELRATDADVVKCRRRYDIFKQHYSTLLRLKSYFPFSLIDACGSLEDCRTQISRELRYQSSLDLGERTYAALRHLPLAVELVRKSRQQLVSHLDSYCNHHNDLFNQVIGVIDAEAVPLLRRCSLAGHADLKTHNTLFTHAPIAADIFIDVLTDRGFSVAHVAEEQIVPERVDLKSGAIHSRVDLLHHFRITFEKAAVRGFGFGAPTRGSEPSDQLAAGNRSLVAGPGGACGGGEWDDHRVMGPFDPRKGSSSLIASPLPGEQAPARTTADQLRQQPLPDPASASEPVAALSASTQEASQAAVQQQGASAVLDKKLAQDEERSRSLHDSTDDPKYHEGGVPGAAPPDKPPT